jgi:hypothetical protein
VTTTPSLLTTDDGPLAAALRRLRQAEFGAAEAKQAVSDAKDALAVALHAAAEPYRIGEEEFPVELVQTLYWDEPSLRVRDLASAFGLRLKTLLAVAGPRTATVACLDCGMSTEVVRRSRSDARRASCEECRFRRTVRELLAAGLDGHHAGMDPPVWSPEPRGIVDDQRRRGPIDPELEDLDDPWRW